MIRYKVGYFDVSINKWVDYDREYKWASTAKAYIKELLKTDTWRNHNFRRIRIETTVMKENEVK